MISVDQYKFIRTAVRLHGKRIREVARLFKHSRKTIRKALEGATQGYRIEKPRAKAVMDAVKNMVDQWLAEDLERPPKQRHTGKRIYNRLKAKHMTRTRISDDPKIYTGTDGVS